MAAHKMLALALALVAVATGAVAANHDVYYEGLTPYDQDMQAYSTCAASYEIHMPDCPTSITQSVTCPAAVDYSVQTFHDMSCCSETTCPNDALTANTTGTFNDHVTDKETYARNLAQKTLESIEQRCLDTNLNTCLGTDASECSYASCSADIGNVETECTERFGFLASCSGYSGLDQCNGRKVNKNKSVLLFADAADVESQEMKEYICGTRSLDAFFKTDHTDDLMWSYFGSTSGMFRNYPGYARERDGSSCTAYDPRKRPWYLAASSGPKDVVLVLDVSGSMNAYVASTKTRLDILKEAMVGTATKTGLLDTFTYLDNIHVVLFSSDAYMLSGFSEEFLFPATADNIASAKTAINSIQATGSTNFRDAFNKAFNVLENSYRNEGSSTGCNTAIIFLTDGRDTSCEDCGSQYIENGVCVCTSEMLNTIDTLQTRLTAAGGRQASIFAYSMGENADDSISRQLACRNGGSWAKILDTDDPMTKMVGYYQFLARSNIYSDNVYWTEPYMDDPTGELVTTAAKAVYESQGGRHLLGVVGVDVPMKSLDSNYASNYNSILANLQGKSRVCAYNSPDQCSMQMLRGDYACAQDLPKDKTCYQASGSTKTFIKVTIGKNYEDARVWCAENVLGGSLAVPETTEEFEFLAGVVPSDGAWIGLRQRSGASEPSGGWAWENDLSGISLGSTFWASGEPNNYNNAEDCAEMDARGSKFSVNDENCDKRIHFICQTTASNFTCDSMATIIAAASSSSSKDNVGGLIGGIMGAIGGVALLLVGGGIAYKNRSKYTVVCCSSNVNMSKTAAMEEGGEPAMKAPSPQTNITYNISAGGGGHVELGALPMPPASPTGYPPQQPTAPPQYPTL